MKTRFTRTSLYLALSALATSLVSVQAYGQAKTTYKEKDLGIFFDGKFKFSHALNGIVKKANMVLVL